MAGKDCPLCAALGRGDSSYSVAVRAGQFTEVFLERRTRLPGYCVVMWRLGHVAEPDDLDPAQASGAHVVTDLMQIGVRVGNYDGECPPSERTVACGRHPFREESVGG